MKPKDVLIAALEAILAQGPNFESGWSLSQSDLQVTKRDGDLTFAISLQSSSHNCSGYAVACSPYWRIQSKRWKNWVRLAKPSWRVGPGSSPFLGDYVRKLETKGPGLGLQTWIFPALGPDDASIQAALSDLSQNVWPIFQATSEPEVLAELVASTYALQVRPMMWGEYFVAIGRNDLAQQVLKGALALSPSLAASFASFAADRCEGRPLPHNLCSRDFEHACELGLIDPGRR